MKQKLSVAPTLKNYDKKNLPKDILAGIIIMAVSIPISMGYAQISGLPAVYGLYGSVFPIILFALFSHITAVYIRCDAAPAALVGAGSAWHGNRGRKQRGHDGCTGVYIFCGTVAFGILLHECRKAGELHICAGYGRIYHRHMYYNHTDAGAKAHGLCGRNRRAF